MLQFAEPSYEIIVIGAAFVEVFGTSNALKVAMFNYLKRFWEDLDLTNFKCGFDTSIARCQLT